MSRMTSKNKTALFELGEDGSSIHTIEISKEILNKERQKLLDKLFVEQGNETWDNKIWLYQLDKGKYQYTVKEQKSSHYIYTKYSNHGVTIYIEQNPFKGGKSSFLRMRINPRKLIEPSVTYLGILSPEKASIAALQNKFESLFRNTLFNSDINSYQLTRVDLCTNLYCDNDKIFRETVRVLRKMPTPRKYERKTRRTKDKHGDAGYNKHYIKFACGTHALVIYDKSHQLKENGLVLENETLPKGVLRFEVQCNREYIRRIEKGSLTATLWSMVKSSHEEIVKHFSRCFPDASFCRIDIIEEKIQASSYKKKVKTAMLKLANELCRKQSVEKALAIFDGEEIETKKLLSKFEKIGILPIPLWKRFCAKQIPGPVALLKGVEKGHIRVEYTEVKYK